MNNYFSQLNKESELEMVNEIKREALELNVPIISDEGLQYLMQLVRLTKARKILEIGTAVAYSAINLALINENIKIDTIERDDQMYHKALENISKVNLQKQINVIYNDALAVELEEIYDIIFIDAAKAQYKKLFEKYEHNLGISGIIVCDNLLFHGLVTNNDEIKSKNLRSLIRKIDLFNKWLSENQKYRTVFLTVGDGMAVSEKK